MCMIQQGRERYGLLGVWNRQPKHAVCGFSNKPRPAEASPSNHDCFALGLLHHLQSIFKVHHITISNDWDRQPVARKKKGAAFITI